MFPRDSTAVPTEEESAALIAPKKVFDLGCLFSSVVIDTFLCGVLLMQTIRYTNTSHKDSIWTKIVVAYSVIMCFIVTAFLWFFVQHIFVQNYGFYAPLLETRQVFQRLELHRQLNYGSRFIAWIPLLDVLTSSGCQSFFAYRAFLLAKRNYLLLTFTLTLIAISFGGAVGANIVQNGLSSQLEEANASLEIFLWLSGNMASDIVITVAILVGLIRSRTGWSHTDKTITRLMRMTFESQLPPTILAIAFVAQFALSPTSFFGFTLQAFQSKLYGVGLLFALNSRIDLQNQLSRKMDRTGGQVFGTSIRDPIQVRVDVETEICVTNYAPQANTVNRIHDGDSVSMNDEKNESEVGNNSEARLTTLTTEHYGV